MNIEDLIIRHECIGGKPNLVPYKDTMGIDTIGIGHNMVSSPLPQGMTPPLTLEQVDQLFKTDLTIVMKSISQLSWFSSLDEVRQAVLIDMCFNMGWGTLRKFVNTLNLIGAGQYAQASKEMLESAWARQLPNRSKEDAEMMLTGSWPDK